MILKTEPGSAFSFSSAIGVNLIPWLFTDISVPKSFKLTQEKKIQWDLRKTRFPLDIT